MEKNDCFGFFFENGHNLSQQNPKFKFAKLGPYFNETVYCQMDGIL